MFPKLCYRITLSRGEKVKVFLYLVGCCPVWRHLHWIRVEYDPLGAPVLAVLHLVAPVQPPQAGQADETLNRYAQGVKSAARRNKKSYYLKKQEKWGLFLRFNKKAFRRKNLYKNIAACHYESGISSFFSFVKIIFPLPEVFLPGIVDIDDEPVRLPRRGVGAEGVDKLHLILLYPGG